MSPAAEVPTTIDILRMWLNFYESLWRERDSYRIVSIA